MTASADGTYRTTVVAVSAAGFVIFLIAAGVGSWLTWSMWNRTQTWTAVTATVEKLEQLCDIEKKNGKNWDFQQALTCEEAAAVVAERDTAFEGWRYVEAEYATIAYEAAGQPQRLTLKSDLVSTEKLGVGNTVPIMVNPANPAEIERPFAQHDVDVFWTMLAFGVGAWLLATGIGVVVANANRRIRRKAAAPVFSTESQWRKQESDAVSNPTPLAGSATPPGTTQPAWRRILRWIGAIVFVAATALSLLAILGSKGNSDALMGAAIIFILGLLVWGVLRLIAGRAAPRAPAQPATQKWGRS
jgi:hypothetical protein